MRLQCLGDHALCLETTLPEHYSDCPLGVFTPNPTFHTILKFRKPSNLLQLTHQDYNKLTTYHHSQLIQTNLSGPKPSKMCWLNIKNGKAATYRPRLNHPLLPGAA
jgi:hypothetical protein